MPFLEWLRPPPSTTAGAARDKPRRLVLCGHSLGGAVVSLFAMHLVLEGQLTVDEASLITVITFASPLFVDEKTSAFVGSDRRFCNMFHHIVNHGDVVPTAFSRFTRVPDELDVSALAKPCVHGFNGQVVV